MMQPLVSVVIPCFNAERYVGDAIESALNQSHRSVEVIVIDDGSDDSSLQVIKSFGEAVVWETGKNAGACRARNRGVELARGSRIQFLDADDFLATEKIERQLRSSDRVAIPFCNVRIVDVDTGSVIVPQHGARTDTFQDICFAGIQTAAPLHHRSHLARVGGFNESLPCAQEYDLHLRLLLAGYKFARQDETLVTLRQVPGSLSSDYVKVMRQWQSIISSAVDSLDSADPETGEKRKVMSAVLARAASHLLSRNEPELARRYFAKSKEIHPQGTSLAFSLKRQAVYRLFGFTLGHRLLSFASTRR